MRSRKYSGGHGVEGTAAFGEVLQVLGPEILDRRRDRTGRTVAEGAERAAQDVVADVQQFLQIRFAAVPVLQPAQDLNQPIGALPAGCALSAGLVGVELRPAQYRS